MNDWANVMKPAIDGYRREIYIIKCKQGSFADGVKEGVKGAAISTAGVGLGGATRGVARAGRWLVGKAARRGTVGTAAASVAPGGTTRLYRAVEASELRDIVNTGVYRSAAGGVEGKYFFPTMAQAENFAIMMEKIGTGPYCITAGCIPAAALRGIEKLDVSGEGVAYMVPDRLLPFFDDIMIHGPK